MIVIDRTQEMNSKTLGIVQILAKGSAIPLLLKVTIHLIESVINVIVFEIATTVVIALSLSIPVEFWLIAVHGSAVGIVIFYAVATILESAVWIVTKIVMVIIYVSVAQIVIITEVIIKTRGIIVIFLRIEAVVEEISQTQEKIKCDCRFKLGNSKDTN